MIGMGFQNIHSLFTGGQHHNNPLSTKTNSDLSLEPPSVYSLINAPNNHERNRKGTGGLT